MAQKKTEEDITKLSFEDSIKRLRTIVDKIEQGEIPLQDSLEQYEQGMALIQHCRQILQTAEKRIEKISKRGEETPEPATEEPAPELESEDEGLF
ncbi:MAG: exodeoxyribonuclease VII small subunit [Sedimentisphaerales bacterium]|jgi:exodeoxyribonuclease VII small subunit|nr:exodeoxyribonuclease VII small subunit [Sedimentisphaerales bacterium]HNY76652.1 exodeoxyribonuclease VII small subunit [Sedimentisphaerales bacterium]HOC61741.1 exodeoxyribonuclease VII small subunit [Sedimentisphaerales bacterium]HOH62573.1 exodeoxyribonuclease VII small subunit [Sedimentisphaerales bacterium]HPY48901.1 exodeoxyribonuclease VII small subunit [Sedimentisphaerales bacterium]